MFRWSNSSNLCSSVFCISFCLKIFSFYPYAVFWFYHSKPFDSTICVVRAAWIFWTLCIHLWLENFQITIVPMFSACSAKKSLIWWVSLFLRKSLCSKKNIPAVTIQKYLAKKDYNIHHSNILRGINRISTKVEQSEDYQKVISKLEFIGA